MQKNLLLVTFLLISAAVSAQDKKIWTGSNTVKDFSSAAGKDPGYIKLRAQIDALSKSANRTNTNVSAVRKLLEDNNSMLTRLYKQSNVTPAKAQPPLTFKKLATPDANNNDTYPYGYSKKEYEEKFGVATHIYYPPYTNSWYMTAPKRNVTDQVYPDTTGSQFSNAKTVFIFRSNPGKQTGPYFHGQEQSFTVPSDPRIMAVVLRFDYSVFITGWDTYGAMYGVDMIIEGSDNLGGPFLSNMMSYKHGVSFNNRWKYINYMIPADTVTSELYNFYKSDENRVSRVVAFITPGSTYKVKFGIGYRNNSQLGANGSYHYMEFILKKITAEYRIVWP